MKFFLILLISFYLSFANATKNSAQQLELPDGKKFDVRLFTTPKQWEKGLGGVREDQFRNDEGALFLYPRPSHKSFWMKGTYFDLDIIFLDENLKILGIQRNLPKHPGGKGPIPTAKYFYSHHVLEIKSRTKLAKKMKTGMVLKFRSSIPLEQIISNIHRGQ